MTNIEALLQYTAANNLSIYGFELGNVSSPSCVPVLSFASVSLELDLWLFEPTTPQSATTLVLVDGILVTWGTQLLISYGHYLNVGSGSAMLTCVVGFCAQEKCGPPPKLFAADYHNLHGLLVKYWPDKASRPLLIGNDCNTNPSYLTQFLPLVADVLVSHPCPLSLDSLQANTRATQHRSCRTLFP